MTIDQAVEAAVVPVDPTRDTATCRCGRGPVLVREPRGSAVCPTCWRENAEGMVLRRGEARARRRG